jgi:hypothetical protein
MSTGNLVLMVGYGMVTGLGLAWFHDIRRANPVYWFLPFQWLIATGTFAILDLSRPSDRAFGALFFLSSFAFLWGSIIADVTSPVRAHYSNFWRKAISPDSGASQLAVILLLLLSLFVTYAYYRAVGYNLLVSLVSGGGLIDFAAARLDAYSGANYYAPGYANQFKNVLLPLCVAVLGAWAWQSGHKTAARLITVVGIPILLAALLGTGQRGFLVYATCAFFFGLWTVTRIRARHLVLVGAIGLFLFGLFSYQLGRIGEFTTRAVVTQMLERLFTAEQQGGLVGFRYVYEREVVWLSNWGQGFAGLLPTRRGSDLDHRLHGVLHGDPRGTLTLATVSSVYHNLGIVGLIGFYLVLGWAYMRLFCRFLMGPRTVLRCFTYGALFFYLAFFVAGTPVGLVNRGVVTLAIVLLIRHVSDLVMVLRYPELRSAVDRPGA